MKKTFFFNNVFYSCGAAVVGKKEGEGPLREYYDKIVDRMGNNIILSNGKVISIIDIVGIYEK